MKPCPLALLLSAALVGSLPMLGGCIIIAGSSGCSESAPHHETRTSTVPHVTGRALYVETGNGEVDIHRAGTDQVTVTAKIRATTDERLKAARVVTERDADGTLRVTVEWPDNKRRGSEGCSFDIAIPDAIGVTAQSSNGGITLRGLAGDADLRSSNGEIDVRDHDGAVRARTSNGGIELVNVTKVDADSSNGSVNIRLRSDATGPVRADTSNGNVTLEVGPAFAGEVVCSTSNGSIRDRTGRATSTTQHSNKRATFRFGDGGQSTLDTSNGTITIEPL